MYKGKLDLEAIVLVRKGNSLSLLHLILHLAHLGRIDLDLRRSQGRRLDKGECGFGDKLAGDPEEGLLEVVVTLRAELVVLQRLFSMECDGLGLDFAILDIDLVTTQNNGDVLAHPDEIAMPLRDILVSHSTSDIEHDNRSVSLNAIRSESELKQHRNDDNG